MKSIELPGSLSAPAPRPYWERLALISGFPPNAPTAPPFSPLSTATHASTSTSRTISRPPRASTPAGVSSLASANRFASTLQPGSRAVYYRTAALNPAMKGASSRHPTSWARRAGVAPSNAPTLPPMFETLPASDLVAVPASTAAQVSMQVPALATTAAVCSARGLDQPRPYHDHQQHHGLPFTLPSIPHMLSGSPAVGGYGLEDEGMGLQTGIGLACQASRHLDRDGLEEDKEDDGLIVSETFVSRRH